MIITNQAFEEATLLKPVCFWDDRFDSVIGLGRLQVNDQESTLRAKSSFHNMIEQGLLDRNLFALRLSDSYHNIGGELRFSSTNDDLFVGPLITFSVTSIYSIDPGAGYCLQGGWQVAAYSVACILPTTSSSAAPENMTFSLAGYVAAFSTVNPWISLPLSLSEPLHELIGANYSNRIPCEKRDSQPSLVITLGSRSNPSPFVLKPQDYIREQPQWDSPRENDEKMCQVEITFHEETSDNVKYIVLGTVFLARWYSVFDYDNATVSRK